MRTFLLVAVLGLCSSQAYARILDDTEGLKGQYIADVGELEPVACPLSGKYDCPTFPANLYRLKFGQCFEIPSYYANSSGDTVLIAVDSAKKISAFVGERFGGFHKYPAIPYQCPDSY